MNVNKVIDELHDLMADPLQRQSAKAIMDRVESRTPIGKITVYLLEMAENGDFK